MIGRLVGIPEALELEPELDGRIALISCISLVFNRFAVSSTRHCGLHPGVLVAA